jgi:hypothetical protein
MMKCCGKERTSKFCPDCGKHLETVGSLESLLRYLECQAKSAEQILKGHEVKNEPGSKLRQNASRKARKWRSWADHVAGIVEKMGTGIQSKDGGV